MEIKIMQQVLDANNDIAALNRKLLEANNVVMFNIISSPGSGKTSLLEKTLPALCEQYKVAVIEGDVATDRDAQRLKRFDIPVIMINTEGGCHLNSDSIGKALKELNPEELDCIFVENVGNLVCPAEFDLGENAKIALVSVSEGDDKPIKYPYLFREAKIAILNKIDLIEHTTFNKSTFYSDLKKVKNDLPVLELSCKNGEGLSDWFNWLENEIIIKKEWELVTHKTK